MSKSNSDIPDIPLANDTRTHIDGFLKNGKSHNPYLLYYNFAKGWDLNSFNTPSEERKEDLFAKFNSLKNSELFEAYRQRLTATAESFKNSGYSIELIKLTTDSRLILGLGGETAYEVGITLHPLYGFPYIPSTAIKGLTRAWAEMYEDLEQVDKQAIFNVFGSYPEKGELKNELSKEQKDAKQLGNVFFLDAVPEYWPDFDIDVMTPHYPDYYKGASQPPGDWQNPKPIKFLTIPKGITFSFYLFSHDSEYQESKRSLEQAKQWLIYGLTELGIGAKTSSGYGYFAPLNTDSSGLSQKGEDVQQEQSEFQKEQELKQQAEQEQSEEEKFIKLIQQTPDNKLKDEFYEPWKALEDEELKTRLAKEFLRVHKDFVKRKKKFANKGKSPMPEYLEEIIEKAGK